MECEGYQELLSARLDGEEDDAVRLDVHLEGCPDCQQWYADAMLITRLAATTPLERARGAVCRTRPVIARWGGAVN